MSEDHINKPFNQDELLQHKKEEELANLRIPDEEEFNGNDTLFRQAMEKYYQKKKTLESELEHLKSTQRKIARGDLGGGFGIN